MNGVETAEITNQLYQKDAENHAAGGLKLALLSTKAQSENRLWYARPSVIVVPEDVTKSTR
jgi:hypothetical protein